MPRVPTDLQDISTKSITKSITAPRSTKHILTKHVFMGAALALSMSLTGCQTFKNLTGGDDGALATASQTDAGYYQDALEALNKEHYLEASELLTELRTFYPTGRFAEQALLDLMYSQFQSKEFELAADNADLFITLYPNNPQVDYAYYVRGVANMQIGTNTLLNVSKQNLAHRDISYMRLAFTNFQELLNRFPTSPYVPDAAQRMSFIYNQFAESEMTAARWYIKREAYAAAANRAKWVFQYYPLSEQTPEAIAILAYSHEQLGIDDLAQKYKTLLQLNYPEWLTANGAVRLDNTNTNSILHTLTFGRLGRSSSDDTQFAATEYEGKTRTQIIQRAAQLQLSDQQVPTQANMPDTSLSRSRRSLNIGLGLPESDSEQINSQTSSSQTASDSVVKSDMVNPTRRTTIPVEQGRGIHIVPNATSNTRQTTDSENTEPENVNSNETSTTEEVNTDTQPTP